MRWEWEGDGGRSLLGAERGVMGRSGIGDGEEGVGWDGGRWVSDVGVGVGVSIEMG